MRSDWDRLENNNSKLHLPVPEGNGGSGDEGGHVGEHRTELVSYAITNSINSAGMGVLPSTGTSSYRKASTIIFAFQNVCSTAGVAVARR